MLPFGLSLAILYSYFSTENMMTKMIFLFLELRRCTQFSIRNALKPKDIRFINESYRVTR